MLRKQCLGAIVSAGGKAVGEKMFCGSSYRFRGGKGRSLQTPDSCLCHDLGDIDVFSEGLDIAGPERLPANVEGRAEIPRNSSRPGLQGCDCVAAFNQKAVAGRG